jgi:hypothetical protein
MHEDDKPTWQRTDWHHDKWWFPWDPRDLPPFLLGIVIFLAVVIVFSLAIIAMMILGELATSPWPVPPTPTGDGR